MPDGQQVFLYPSVSNAATATGPAAGATIVSQVLPSGLMDIEVWIGVSATSAVAADSNNMKVSFGATDLIKFIPCSVTTTGTTNAMGPVKLRVFGDGTTALTVKAVANATATSIYAASVTATRVGP